MDVNALVFTFGSSLCTLVGGLFAVKIRGATKVIAAFAWGFLYLGASELLPSAHDN